MSNTRHICNKSLGPHATYLRVICAIGKANGSEAQASEPLSRAPGGLGVV